MVYIIGAMLMMFMCGVGVGFIAHSMLISYRRGKRRTKRRFK